MNKLNTIRRHGPRFVCCLFVGFVCCLFVGFVCLVVICIQLARVSKNAKFRRQARMFLTSGYVLITCVLDKLGILHTFRRDFSQTVACS